MANGGGKRAGSRKGPKKRTPPDRRVLMLASGITACIVAWGYLVFAAIDFGGSARNGQGSSWFFLLLACLGAAACLFAGLMLAARLLRALGITEAPAPPSESSASHNHAGHRH